MIKTETPWLDSTRPALSIVGIDLPRLDTIRKHTLAIAPASVNKEQRRPNGTWTKKFSADYHRERRARFVAAGLTTKGNPRLRPRAGQGPYGPSQNHTAYMRRYRKAIKEMEKA